jgi:hypothetical protein
MLPEESVKVISGGNHHKSPDLRIPLVEAPPVMVPTTTWTNPFSFKSQPQVATGATALSLKRENTESARTQQPCEKKLCWHDAFSS